MHHLTEKIIFKNSLLINLKFKMIHFSHSVDFSDNVLINARFYDCFFYKCYQYSFDRADLRNCSFQECYCVDYDNDDEDDDDTDGEILNFQNKQQFKEFIRSKTITFYGAKNIEFIKVDDEEIKIIIKAVYNL